MDETLTINLSSGDLQEGVMLTANAGFRTLNQSKLKRLSEEISKIVKEEMRDKEEGKENRAGKGAGSWT